MLSLPHAVLPILLSLSQSPPHSGPATLDPWHHEIDARIADGARAFRVDGEAFVASSSQDLHGSFDAAGAWLVRGEEVVGIRTTAWGRRGAMESVRPGRPALGACQPGREDPEGACLRRLEYADAEIAEWWAATSEGFEQGWTLTAPPAGDGPLVLEVAVDGADAVVGDGEAWLEGDGGEAWHVAGLVAWDANGTPLDAWFELGRGGLRVVVDDDGARYPVDIDPVYETATSTLTGDPTNEHFGISVSGAGDVDGDGYDDVIVGASGERWSTGWAFLFHGSAVGVSTVATTTLAGEAVGDSFGGAVSEAGDVNGDGYGDVIVGASGYSSYTGRAYVYHGSASGLSTPAATTLTGEATNNMFGFSVSGSGDVDGDGYDDVIVGAPYNGSMPGRAYVYRGSADGVSAPAATVLTGQGELDHFGISVSGAGDVDGDGFDDVVVGADYGGSVGRAYVHPGGPSGVSTTAASTLTGEETWSLFGYSVSGAGDVNGDGYDDVIVGAYCYGSYAGRAYVYTGSTDGVSASAATTLTGEDNDWFGISVSGAGDVDADGYDDVIVGAIALNPFVSQAHLYRGSASGVSASPVNTLAEATSYDGFGYSVSGAGDVDADGYGDVIVGAPYHDGSGTASVYLGYADNDGDGYAAEDDCDDTRADVHPDATEICDEGHTDEDCDGMADDADASVQGAVTFYVDADGDGYGDGAEAVEACEQPDGHVTNDQDCDDGDGAINPGAVEVCDDADADENCNGAADDADDTVTDRPTYYPDADGDGYAAIDGDALCDPPEGSVTSPGDDCDDDDPDVHPGAADVDGEDRSCDGVVDSGCGCASPTSASSRPDLALLFALLLITAARRREK